MSAMGTTINELRRAVGLGRPELAKLAGISRVFLGKIEQGSRQPSPRTLTAIAAALNVTAAELMARAALVDASGADTDEEMKRRLIRSLTVGAGGFRPAADRASDPIDAGYHSWNHAQSGYLRHTFGSDPNVSDRRRAPRGSR